MKCSICGSNGWINSVLMKKPDKYEKWMGITDVRRRWRKCLGCGTWHHLRNYPLEDLDKIYCDGYRNVRFRDETIGEAFSRISKIPNSENDKRIDWGEGKDFLTRQKKLQASASKVIKERLDGSAKEAKKQADEQVVKAAVEAGLESNTALGGAAGAGEDAFIADFNAGKLNSPADIARA